MSSLALRAFILVSLALWTGCATAPGPRSEASLPTREPWPIYTLRAEQVAPLNLVDGERFDASALLLTPAGDLLTIKDRGPTLYRILLPPGAAEASLVTVPDCFTAAQLAPFAREKTDHYDCEGLAQDEQGRIYLCEEANRWILRCDPRNGSVERLAIDWSPVKKFFSADRNASFEGIAIGEGKLFVANERSDPVIIVVDLATLRVIDHFTPRPRTSSFLGILHYSDLSWFDGRLWVLCRQHRCVLAVDPRTHAVLAEFDYEALESELGYKSPFPVRVGVMEGLAVDHNYLWLATDNNGLPRAKFPNDIRPTLLKCRRPDTAKLPGR